MSRRPVSTKAGQPGESTIVEETSNHKMIAVVDEEAKPVSTLQLDSNEEETVPLSLSEGCEDEKEKRMMKHWLDSPFAAGLTEASWMDERTRKRSGQLSCTDETISPDTSGCLCCSAMICPLLGAGRVGNMAVLKSSTEWVEEMVQDEETGEETVRRVTQPKLDIVVGPFWPMLVFVTYPIILVVSGFAFFGPILHGRLHPMVVLAWVVCTVGIITALGFTSCRDPGILLRHKTSPGSTWRWSDHARSYRPRGSHYDTDTAVVVEGFDHT